MWRNGVVDVVLFQPLVHLLFIQFGGVGSDSVSRKKNWTPVTLENGQSDAGQEVWGNLGRTNAF